jgi:hypothetical protein
MARALGHLNALDTGLFSQIIRDIKPKDDIAPSSKSFASCWPQIATNGFVSAKTPPKSAG